MSIAQTLDHLPWRDEPPDGGGWWYVRSLAVDGPPAFLSLVPADPAEWVGARAWTMGGPWQCAPVPRPTWL